VRDARSEISCDYHLHYLCNSLFTCVQTRSASQWISS